MAKIKYESINIDAMTEDIEIVSSRKNGIDFTGKTWEQAVKSVTSSGDDLVITTNNKDYKVILKNYFAKNGKHSIKYLNTTSEGYQDLPILDYVRDEDIFGASQIINTPVKGKLNGTVFNDRITGTTVGDKIYGNDGNDVISGEEGNDTITGGKGINTILLSTKKSFGDDTVVLTKGETLYFKLDDDSNINLVDVDIVGKNLVITVNKDSQKLKSTVTIKNYTKKDVLTSAGDLLIVNQDETQVLKDIREFPVVTYMDSAHYTKSSFTGTWMNDEVHAEEFVTTVKKGKTSDETKGVTIKLGDSVEGSVTSENQAFGSIYADTIKGGAHSDTIYGGRGNDNITGGAGKNLVVYEDGDGHDIINLSKNEELAVWLKDKDLANVKIEYANKNKDVKIWYADESGQEAGSITLKNIAKKNPAKSVVLKGQEALHDTFDFATDYIETEVDKANFTGTLLNDLIDASKSGELKNKNDKHVNMVLNGGKGDDYVLGSIYADTLKGGDGDDILEGGKGNDLLYGDNGNDTFNFYSGDGVDTIYSGKGEDTINFVGSENDPLLLSHKTASNNKDLILYYGLDEDSYIIVKDYYKKDGTENPKCSVKWVQYNSGEKVLLSDALKNEPPEGSVVRGSGNNFNIQENTQIVIGSNSDDTPNVSESKEKEMKINLYDGNDTVVGKDDVKYVITGGDGDKTITTTNKADEITVGDGHHTISAGAGENTIYAGDNTSETTLSEITTGVNKDIINVGDNYTISAGSGNNEITAGDITIEGAVASVTTYDGNDTIYVGDNYRTISAGAGNNTIYAGDNTTGVAATVTAGAGDDTIYVGDGDYNISSIQGLDNITAGNGNHTISTGVVMKNGATIKVGDGNNTITTGNGIYTKIIETGNGNQTITTDGGDDEITVGNGLHNINAGNGDNTIYAGNNTSTESAGVINTLGGDDTIYVGSGAYTITTIQGQNTIVGTGDGKKTITVGNEDYHINEGQTISTGTGDDEITIYGRYTGTSITSEGGNNTIRYGKGLNGQGGEGETITTGAGNDTIYIADTENSGGVNGMIINAGAGDNTIYMGAYATDESITTGDGNDKIYFTGKGHSYDNTIYAGNGNNTIEITQGHSFNITTGSGDDRITKGDSAEYTSETYKTTINAGAGNNTITMGQGIYDIETGDGNQIITTSGGADNITAGNGLHNINAGNGDNTIYVGNNTSTASAGVINTGDGDDTIYVGSGAYTITDLDGENTIIATGDGKKIITVGDNEHYPDKQTIVTGGGDDEITVYDYNDGTSITSSGGNNFIHYGKGMTGVGGGGETATIETGAGDDTIYIGEEGGIMYGTTVKAGEGTNTIAFKKSSAQNTIYGGSGVDTITFGAGSSTNQNTIYAGEGDNIVTLSDGNRNEIHTGAGDDIITVGNGSNTEGYENTIYAGDGHNIINVGEGRANIYAGDSTVTDPEAENYNIGSEITVNAGGRWTNHLEIETGSGDDTIKVDVCGNDNDVVSINAGAGDNHIEFGYGVDYSSYGGAAIITGDGNDKIIVGKFEEGIGTGAVWQNTIYAGNGTNTVDISYGSQNTIYGGSGKDIINIAATTTDKLASENKIWAGDGDNEINLGTDGSGNTIYTGSGIDTIYVGDGAENEVYSGAGSDKVYVIESDKGVFDLGEGNNELSVTSGVKDTIYGGSGNDTIEYGYASQDTIYAGNGTNTVTIGGGYGNTIYGGSGVDTIVINGSGSDNVVNAGDGDNVITTGVGMFADVDVTTGSGADTIYMRGRATISSGAGADTIYVGDSKQTAEDKNFIAEITAGTGDDTIYLDENKVGGTDIYFTKGDGHDVVKGLTSNGQICIKIGEYDYLVKHNETNNRHLDLMLYENGVATGDVLTIENFWIEGWVDEDDVTNTSISINYSSHLLATSSNFYGQTNLVKLSEGQDGTDYNDLIYGTDGNDEITAADGYDIIRPGKGDDSVDVGTSYSNKYIYFDRGDGNLTVKLNNTSAKACVIMEDIGEDTTTFERHGVDIHVIRHLDETNTETLIFQDAFESADSTDYRNAIFFYNNKNFEDLKSLYTYVSTKSIDIYPDETTGVLAGYKYTTNIYHTDSAENRIVIPKNSSATNIVYGQNEGTVDTLDLSWCQTSGYSGFTKEGDDLIIKSAIDYSLDNPWIPENVVTTTIVDFYKEYNTVQSFAFKTETRTVAELGVRIRAVQYFNAEDATNPIEGTWIQDYIAQNLYNYEDINNVTINSGGGNDEVVVDNRVKVSATLDGGEGDDILKAENMTQGKAYLYGDEGSDTLKGNKSETHFYGGTGNDTITGYTESQDYFYFTLGDGDDTISGGSLNEEGAEIVGVDRIKIDGFPDLENIDLTHRFDGRDLILEYNYIDEMPQDSITITNYLDENSVINSPIKFISYGDGEGNWTSDENIPANFGVIATADEGHKTLTGTPFNDTLRGPNDNVAGVTMNAGTGDDKYYGGMYSTVVECSDFGGRDEVYMEQYGAKSYIRFTDLNLADAVSNNMIKFELNEYGAMVISYANSGDDPAVVGYANSITLKQFSDLYNPASEQYPPFNQLLGKDDTPAAANPEYTVLKLYKNTVDGTPAEISGTEWSDSITLSNGYHTVNSGYGDDVIKGANGGGQIYAQDGDDLIDYRGVVDYATLEGGFGNDTIYGGSGADTIYGDNEIYYDEDGNDTIYGGAGADNIFAGKGNDIVYGEAGNDVIYGYEGNDTIYGGDGVNELYGNDGKDTIYTGDYGDVVDGGNGDDTIYGGAGIDTINGGNSADTIYGGAGADIINGDGGADIIYGEDGNDHIEGGAGNDTIYGGAGADYILDSAGTNDIWGGNGNDELRATAGTNTLHFEDGDGVDDVYFSNNAGGQTLKFEDQDFDNLTMTVDRENNLFNIAYGTSDDKVVVHGLTNALNQMYVTDQNGERVNVKYSYSEGGNTGTEGKDALYGIAGANFFWGKGGNDLFFSGGTADTYRFMKGDGNDTIKVGTDESILTFEELHIGDINFTKDGSDMVVYYNGAEDSVRVENYFSTGGHSFKFTTMDSTEYNVDSDGRNHINDVESATVTGDAYFTNYIKINAANTTISGGDNYNFYTFDASVLADGVERTLNIDNYATDTLTFKNWAGLTGLTTSVDGDDILITDGGADPTIKIRITDGFTYPKPLTITDGSETTQTLLTYMNANNIYMQGDDSHAYSNDNEFISVYEGTSAYGGAVQALKGSDVISVNRPNVYVFTNGNYGNNGITGNPNDKDTTAGTVDKVYCDSTGNKVFAQSETNKIYSYKSNSNDEYHAYLDQKTIIDDRGGVDTFKLLRSDFSSTDGDYKVSGAVNTNLFFQVDPDQYTHFDLEIGTKAAMEGAAQGYTHAGILIQNNQVETITTNDGYHISSADIDALAQAAAGWIDDKGYTSYNQMKTEGGADVVKAYVAYINTQAEAYWIEPTP